MLKKFNAFAMAGVDSEVGVAPALVLVHKSGTFKTAVLFVSSWYSSDLIPHLLSSSNNEI
jgi:hypothetical protein